MHYTLPPVSRHALIIGAGIAGSAMALFLRKIGISATVYEAQAQLHDIGGGLHISPNGMQVLEALGLADMVKAHGNIITHMRFRNGPGKLLARIPNGAAEKYGQPAVFIARPVFHRLLAEEVHRQGVQVSYNKRLKDIFDLPGKEVVASFSDGTTAHGNFLIGADGIHSRTRRLILPESPVSRFTGWLNLGGFVPLSAIAAGHLPGRNDMEMSFGQNGFFGYGICSPEPEAALTWWSNLPLDQELSREELKQLTTDDLWAKLLEAHRGWHPPVEELIRHTSVMLKTTIYEVPPIPAWYRDRVVLIGDAAHAMSPHAGQGSSLALEDAMYLAKLLRQLPSQYERVFSQFEQKRRPRVEKVNAQARRNGDSKQTKSPLTARLRDFFMAFFLQHFGEKSMDSMYRYKIQWED